MNKEKMKNKTKIGMLVSFLIVVTLLSLSATSQPSGPQTTILDEKTEETCTESNNIRTCIWKQYEGKKFEYYKNKYWFYEDFLTITEESNLDLKYLYEDNTEITLTPLVEINTQKELNNLSSENKNQLNYQSAIDKQRDYSKFSIEFNKIQDLTQIGFKITSNENIEYLDYNYIKEGIYELDENETVPEYSITDLIIDGKRFSFVDLIESGFNIEFNKENNELWIDLSNKEGAIVADPMNSYYTLATDGHLVIDDVTGCTLAVSSTTTNQVGDNNGLSIQTWAFQNYENTSLLPDNADIISVNHYIYAHAYNERAKVPPANLWDFDYWSAKKDYGSLDCSDQNKPTTSEGTLDWQKTTGWKSKSIATSSINLTGPTMMRISPAYDMVGATDEGYATWRAAEYGSSTSYLKIEYNYSLGDYNETDARTAMEEGITNAIPSSTIYTDKQVYVYHLNGLQERGLFDKVSILNNQTWALNYNTTGEVLTNLSHLGRIVNIWQNESLTYDEVRIQVESFINRTKW